LRDAELVSESVLRGAELASGSVLRGAELVSESVLRDAELVSESVLRDAELASGLASGCCRQERVYSQLELVQRRLDFLSHRFLQLTRHLGR
jgi:hypothetical protein